MYVSKRFHLNLSTDSHYRFFEEIFETILTLVQDKKVVEYLVYSFITKWLIMIYKCSNKSCIKLVSGTRQILYFSTLYYLKFFPLQNLYTFE